VSNQDQPSPEDAPGPAGQGSGTPPGPPQGQPGYSPQGPTHAAPPGYGSGQQPGYPQQGYPDYGTPQPYGGQPQQYDPNAYGQPPSYDPNAYGQQPPYGGDPGGYTPVTFEQPLGAPGTQPPGYGGYDTGGMGGFPPTGPSYPAQQATGGGGNNKGLFLGLGAVALVLVLGITGLVVALFRSGGDNPGPQPTQAGPASPSTTGGAVTPANTGNGSLPGQPKPSIYLGSNSNTSSTFDKIKERSNDSKPLTLDEVFTGDGAAPAYEGKNVRFKLTNQDLTTDCGSLVWGDKLKNDLKAAGCTQAVRGAYVSTDGKAIAVGVAFNLKSSTDAARVVDTLDPEKGAGGWVLTPRTGNDVEKLGKGYTWGKGDGMGHFVCVTATQRTDGASPGLGSDDLIPYSVAMSDFESFVYQRNIN